MFVYFAKNKFSYEKGQLAPFFIVAIVVLIIMAMVTVNLSKVASVKTESGNAADAGALAAGSTMAKVFNVVAQANSELEFYYTDFIVAVMLSYVITFIYLGMAMAKACPPATTCAALESVGNAIKGIISLMISVTGYWIAAEYFYCKIREMADQGREAAVAIVGHQFAFINSGIGSKLDQTQRDAFSRFLQKKMVGDKEERSYSWQDGQGRAHLVRSRVEIDEVKDYRLHTTLMPFPAEIVILGGALGTAYAAKGILTSTCGAVPCCFSIYGSAQCCSYIAAACITANILMAVSIGLLATSATGLMPASSASSSSCGDAWPWIITWIDDIEHNRLVKVDNWQEHEGADLGLWETRYPQMHSLSWVDFRGNGSIHPPELRHDASIIKTDQSDSAE